MTQIYSEDNALIKGHWKLDVYEGDVRRERLPLRQRLWNAWADCKWRLFRLPSSHYYRGEVLNRHIETLEGNNLVVTVGKQMIMDRLFGLSGVSAVARIGVGTSATAAAVGNTTLTGGVFKVFDATPIRSSLTVTCITTFLTTDANINWQELGMDNNTTLLNRIAPIGPFNKTTSVSIVVTCTLVQQ